MTGCSAKIFNPRKIEINQYFPQEGWVEECPNEILNSCLQCIDRTIEEFYALKYKKDQLKCIGITNQRETTIVWDKNTGAALHNAIVWCDARAKGNKEQNSIKV